MQSSGVGNCISMLSLLQNCRFACLIVVTMRGEFAEFNPWQVSMGSITEQTLKLCGFLGAAEDVVDGDNLKGEVSHREAVEIRESLCSNEKGTSQGAPEAIGIRS